MAQIPYRANLSAAIFPMTLARSGRSVIIPQADQNFNRSIDSPDDSNRDVGIPQIIYGENILPTADGYQSVGYTVGASLGLAVVPWKFITATGVLGAAKNIIFAIAGGNIKISTTGLVWLNAVIVGTVPPTINSNISTATVRGNCYLQVDSEIYLFNPIGPTFTNVSATFLPVGILSGLYNICASYNYLILLKNDGVVYWSSTTTPTDFTPSLISGAGSGAVNNISGYPVKLKSAATGFFVYCTGNIISARYTGNARYPWRFEPIPGSEGIFAEDKVAGEIADSNQVALSSAGVILNVTADVCTIIAQEVGEFLTRLKYRDRFDYATNTFSVQDSTNFLDGQLRISYLMDRYIIVSLRNDLTTTLYTEAIVYDVMFKRYGKFNVRHSYVVDVDVNGTSGPEPRALYFIEAITGNSKLLSLDVNDPTVDFQGVLVLGKFQYVRSRFLALDEISVESAQLPSLVPTIDRNFELYTIPTLDGKTFLPVETPYLVSSQSTGAVQTYYSTTEGKNISILIKGNFDLCSVEMKFHLGGQN